MTATVESMPAIYPKSVIVVTTKSGDQIFRVKKINAKSLVVTEQDGKEGRFATPFGFYRHVRQATALEIADFVKEEFVLQTAPAKVMRVGNIVRWPAATHSLAKGKLLVVTKTNADGAANLSPLGGTLTGEFFRSVPAALLEKAEGFDNA